MKYLALIFWMLLTGTAAASDAASAPWSCLGPHGAEIQERALRGELEAMRKFVGETSDCNPNHALIKEISLNGAKAGDRFLTDFYLAELRRSGEEIQGLGYALKNVDRGSKASRSSVFYIVTNNDINALLPYAESLMTCDMEKGGEDGVWILENIWTAYALNGIAHRSIDAARVAVYYSEKLSAAGTDAQRPGLLADRNSIVAAIGKAGLAAQFSIALRVPPNLAYMQCPK